MRKIIYKKDSLKCVGTVAEGMTTDAEIKLNVIPNFGGEAEDYGVIETDKAFFSLALSGDKVSVVENMSPPIERAKSIEERVAELEARLTKIEGL